MTKIIIEDLYKIFGPKASKMMPLVKAGLSKDELLGQYRHSLALDNINLKIEEAQIFVIMGLSGSGKSTLIRHFNGLIKPTCGRIVIDGQDVAKMNKEEIKDLRRNKMSMVFQKFGLLPHRNVLENVAFGLKAKGVSAKERHARALSWLDKVGLQGHEKMYPDQLSGGMQQRIGIARALCNDSDIILMDEPFSALDPLIRHEMQNQVLSLQKDLKKTIIFITHDLDEALKLGDVIAILKDGEVVQVGSGTHILANPANEYIQRFVKGVNLAHVLTAEQAMRSAKTLQIGRNPDETLIKKRLENYPHDTVFFVNKDREFFRFDPQRKIKENHRRQLKRLHHPRYQENPTSQPRYSIGNRLDRYGLKRCSSGCIKRRAAFSRGHFLTLNAQSTFKKRRGYRTKHPVNHCPLNGLHIQQDLKH